jgi:hypothetical protein
MRLRFSKAGPRIGVMEPWRISAPFLVLFVTICNGCVFSLSLSPPPNLFVPSFSLSLSFWGLFFGFVFSVPVACLCWLELLPVRATFLFVMLCFNKIWKVHIAFFACVTNWECVCVCVFVAQVYTTLACALLVSAVGVYMHMLLHIGGLITSLAFIATTMWLVSTPATPVNEVSRFSLVCAFHNTVTVMTWFCYNCLLQLISVAAVSLSCGDITKLLLFSVGQGKRLALLTGAAFCEGASLGTLVEAVLHFDPRYTWYRSL